MYLLTKLIEVKSEKKEEKNRSRPHQQKSKKEIN